MIIRAFLSLSLLFATSLLAEDYASFTYAEKNSQQTVGLSGSDDSSSPDDRDPIHLTRSFIGQTIELSGTFKDSKPVQSPLKNIFPSSVIRAPPAKIFIV